MSSLDQAIRPVLEAAVKIALQEGRKWDGLPPFINQISQQGMLSRDFLNKHQQSILELYIQLSPALNGNQLPPSPPGSDDYSGNPELNGVAPVVPQRSGDGFAFVPVDDPQKPDCVSISIHLGQGDSWKGIRATYGMLKESFISQKIVKRFDLQLDEGKIRLTWFLGEDPKTYQAWFHAVPDEKLKSDCLLGTHCQKSEPEYEEQHDDEDEQRSEGSHARSEHFGASLPIQILPSNAALPTTQTEDEILRMAARMNAESAFHIRNIASRQGPQRMLMDDRYVSTNVRN